MTAGIVTILLIAAGTAAFVIAPLLRRDAAEAERVAAARSEYQELRSRHDMLLAALKDLEDDRDTGKIGDADFRALHARLSHEAIEVMQRLDELEAERAARARPKVVASRAAERTGPAS